MNSTIDTVSLRWQKNIPTDCDLRDDGWQPHYNFRFGNIDKWTHNRKDTNLPRFTWSQPSDRDSWLTAEFSAPYLIHGTNALDVDNQDISKALDFVSEYASTVTGVDCDSRQSLPGRIDYASNFAVGEKDIPLYLEAALGAKVSRFQPPRRESSTAVCVEGKSRKIQLYDKHADILHRVETGRLEGNAARIALESSFGVLRLESRFRTTQWVARLAKSLDVERSPENLLNCEIAEKVIAMDLKKLSLDKPVEPVAARLESLVETFGGNYKKVSELYGFLALRDRYGDGFHRFPQLGISKATYHRKVRELKDAGLWLSVSSERSLSALSEAPQADSQKRS
jgi:hypothetical protein